MIKKIIAVILVLLIFGWGSWNAYATSGSVLAGLLYVPTAILFGGIGGLIGIFCCKAFNL